jgi:serine/threonine protein phosphatase PrpC
VSKFLRSVFGSSGMADPKGSNSLDSSDQPTQPFDFQSGNRSHQKMTTIQYPYTVGIGTSIGLHRDHNEDSIFAMTSIMVSSSSNIPIGLYIVADGMGGHLHGEKASEVAVHAMVSSIISNLFSYNVDNPNEEREESIQELMVEGMHSAHQAILQQAPGGGSTLTGLLILHDQMTIAHIGDSRAYHIDPNGEIQVLTTDHSLVKRLQDLGQITSDEAAIHPQRNVLYRALGQAEPIDAEVITSPMPSAGYLMVCSDGLWGVVSDNEMVETITTADSPQEASQKLLEAANTAGGPDNISVVMIEIPD